jgi:hypothetical protein
MMKKRTSRQRNREADRHKSVRQAGREIYARKPVRTHTERVRDSEIVEDD